MGLDPELAAAIQAHPVTSQPPAPPPPGVDLVAFEREATRRIIYGLSQYYGERLSESKYSVVDKRVPVEGGEITVRHITPVNADDPDATYPVLVWYHGGGWRIGDLEMDDNHLRSIAVDLQIVVVNVDYRLCPEYPFPTQFEDSYTALKWVVENAPALKIALDKGFLVGGDSAGANMSAGISIRARDDPFFAGRGLTGQYLREPCVVHPSAPIPEKYKADMRSMVENKDAPLMNAESALFALNAYCPNPKDQVDPRMSPLLAASHAGLPRAFFQVMEIDPVRDDGIVYEKALREAGVETRLILNPGVPHGFHYTFPSIAAGLKLDRDEREGLKWLLSFSK